MYQQPYSHEALNNPFQQPASSRFPDLSGSANPEGEQFTSWMNPGGSQQSPPPSLPIQPQQQMYAPTGMVGPTSPTGAYDPYNSSLGTSFGLAGQPVGYGDPNQLLPQVYQNTAAGYSGGIMSTQTGSGYGYLSPHPTQSQPQQYAPASSQLQSPGYVSSFDPYGPIAQGWGGPSSANTTPGSNPGVPQPPPYAAVPTSPTTTKSPTGQSHPRDLLRANKTALESWETAAWKSLLASFDTLKNSWSNRRLEAEERLNQLQIQGASMGPGGYGFFDMSTQQTQQEAQRLRSVGKEAEGFADTIAASTFQMHEVFSSYRQSSDIQSKQRVREACNAAISALPDWPPSTI
ncbi:hypothetical protein DL96DRAFT_1499586 [Flagelloscypha sp. PMI_526]|nr:hypothetical protein DL96DRAFT_1499586 [Flagelloscypha sp. PMI_526]